VRRTIILATMLACGGNDSGPPANGPVYTAGVQYALTGLAPDCTLAKPTEPGVKRQYTCAGRKGTLVANVGEGDRLRRVEIRLRSMTLVGAKAHLEPALRPILDQAALAQLGAKLDALALGESATLELGTARATIAAKGPSTLFPEYSLDLTW
jgi:hypothetical protein